MSGSGTAFFKGRKVVITGCTGFLGTWLAKTLSGAGALVTGFGRGSVTRCTPFALFGLQESVPLRCVEMTRPESVEAAVTEISPECIFHLAAVAEIPLTLKQPLHTFETNVRGTWNLLEAVRRTGQPIRVLLASTDLVYGDGRGFPFNEDRALNGRAPYETSKICAELVVNSYAFMCTIPAGIVRFSSLYGGGDVQFSRLIPGTIRSALNGEAPVLRSSGGATRDYLYVEDAVSALVSLSQALDRPNVFGEAFNVCSGQSTEILEVVRMILSAADRPDLKPVVQGGSSGEVSHERASYRKIQERLGWEPGYALSEGIQKTVTWYRNHLAAL